MCCIFPYHVMMKRLTTTEQRVKSCLKDRISRAKTINLHRFGMPRTQTNIDVQYMYNMYLMQQGRCIYTQQPLYVMPRHERRRNALPTHHDHGISIDRINSDAPYCRGNVQLVTFLFNKMKQNNTNEQLFHVFKNVLADHQGYLDRLSRILQVS